LEFIKVTPENFGLAMGYLDDHWVRVREEAKRQGAVLSYHRISNAGLVTPSHRVWDQNSIVLLTEYKNMDSFMESQKSFDDSTRGPIRWQTQGVIRLLSPEGLNTQVFVEEPGTNMDTNMGLKLLTKQ
jgi:hypothetical protein